MSISIRFYLFADDGSLRRVPKRIANEIGLGDEAIPEYAGTTQRIAQVVVDCEDGRPARIMDARGFFWTFDAQGHLDRDAERHVLDRMNEDERARRSRAGRVVSLVPEIKRKEQEAKEKQTLTAEDLDRIAADLWPGINGPAEDVTSVKGTKPKKPALTFEARHALRDIGNHVFGIAAVLGGLTERALKGVAFEAHRMGTLEHEALWHGVAEEAKRFQAIRIAHRTGRGEWYAVIEVVEDDPENPRVRRTIWSDHAKCANRKEAIEAGRRLMSEKANWLGERTSVEVSICSALEWRAGAED